MAKFQLREFEPGDYDRIAEIFGALEPEHPPSIEELRYNDETFDRSKYVLKRYVALENSGLVIGIARYSHTPWMFHPKKFWMGIYVDPAKQCHGVGTALYERIIQDLRFIGAITVRATAREDRPEAVSFLSKRGFKEKMRSWDSVAMWAVYSLKRTWPRRVIPLK